MDSHKKYYDFTNEISPDEIYKGLLAYGLFTEKLPPIFFQNHFLTIVRLIIRIFHINLRNIFILRA